MATADRRPDDDKHDVVERDIRAQVDAAAISAALTALLRDAVRAADGFLPFVEVMQRLLYAPGLGYYVNGRHRFGVDGDFVTAPGVSDLFGATLAGALDGLHAETGVPRRVFEFGAGDGSLASQVLAESLALGRPFEDYAILEVSPDLRAQQRETLEAALGSGEVCRVRWVDAPPAGGFSGAVLANEVLDAFPVEWFVWRGAAPVGQVGLWLDADAAEDGALRWGERDAPVALDAVVRRLHARHGPWPEGYRSEFCPALRAWLQMLAASMDRGLVWLADYGYPGSARYTPERSEGTLAGTCRHRRVVDPLDRPGQVDWTAHVDFSATAEAAQDAGFGVAHYSGQGEFLLAAGLAERFLSRAGAVGDVEGVRLAAAVRKLTLPGEMGETFQMLWLTRGVDWPGRGWPDRRERL